MVKAGITIMKKNNFGYYIKECFGGIRSHGFMSFASVCIIVACLIVMGSFSLVALNINSMIASFEDENVVLAFIDEDYSESQARGMQDDIEALEYVERAEFISRDEAYDDFIQDYSDTSMFDDVDSSILRDRFAVYITDAQYTEQVKTELEGLEGVANINANLGVAEGFVTARNIASAVSIVLLVILLVISLFIISNTIKLVTFDRKEEIAIMKMVGATNSFIRWPFVLQGFVTGIFASGLAYLAQWGIYKAVSEYIVSSYGESFISLVPFATVAIPLLIVFVGIGFIVGVLGSVIAIKNYLKV